MIADSAFAGVPFISDIMNVPVVAVGVFPITETSKDLPSGWPGHNSIIWFFGRVKQAVLRARHEEIGIRRAPNRVLWQLLDKYMIAHNPKAYLICLLKIDPDACKAALRDLNISEAT